MEELAEVQGEEWGTVCEWVGDDEAFLALLTKIVFCTGFSRVVVERRWTAFCLAFGGFDLNFVAAMDELMQEALCKKDSGIVRNARKVSATVANAGICLAYVAEFGPLCGLSHKILELGEKEGAARLRRMFHQVGEAASVTLYKTLAGLDASWWDAELLK